MSENRKIFIVCILMSLLEFLTIFGCLKPNSTIQPPTTFLLKPETYISIMQESTMFSFDWGPGWFFPKFGCWYASWWNTVYDHERKEWFFPSDLAWYNISQDFSVQLLKSSSPHIILKNEGNSALYFAIYQKDDASHFTQIKSVTSIAANSKSRLCLTERDKGEIVVISRNYGGLTKHLTENKASKLSSIEIDRLKQFKCPAKGPSNALRFYHLDAETKTRLRNAAQEIEASDMYNNE